MRVIIRLAIAALLSIPLISGSLAAEPKLQIHGIAHPVVVRCALLDRRMMYFDNHKLKRNFQDSLQVCLMSF